MLRILEHRFWLTKKRNYNGDYRYNCVDTAPKSGTKALGFGSGFFFGGVVYNCVCATLIGAD